MSGCLGLLVEAGIECKWTQGNLGDNENVLKLDCGDIA